MPWVQEKEEEGNGHIGLVQTALAKHDEVASSICKVKNKAKPGEAEPRNPIS